MRYQGCSAERRKIMEAVEADYSASIRRARPDTSSCPEEHFGSPLLNAITPIARDDIPADWISSGNIENSIETNERCQCSFRTILCANVIEKVKIPSANYFSVQQAIHVASKQPAYLPRRTCNL